MDNFKSPTLEFRLNEPDTYPRNLRGATIGECEEQYMFLLCAYDFVYNPDAMDRKLTFMWNYFLKEPKYGNHIVFDTMWFVNIGREYTAKIDALLVNPTVTLSIENKQFNAVPPPPGFRAKISPATGNPSFPAAKALNGGVLFGGAANYNLFTKAIDVACAAFGNMNRSIADTIVKNRDSALNSSQKVRLAERYTTMRDFYNEQTLTRFGLIYR